jgi:hypothetical protein
MDKQLFNDWKRHPVTIIFSELIIEHRIALEKALLDSKFEIETIGINNRIKGQIVTLEMLEDLDNFLIEKIHREEDIVDEENA